MKNSVIEQPTFTALSTTTANFAKKVNTQQKGSCTSCLFNTTCGTFVGFACTALNPFAGPYLAPMLAGGFVGACATCSTMVTKSVNDRVIVIIEQPKIASSGTLAPVKTEQH